MMRKFTFAAVLSLAFLLTGAPPPPGAVRLKLSPVPGVTEASLDYLPTSAGGEKLRGIIAFVPGADGLGSGILTDKGWVNFARDNGLILSEFSFTPETRPKNGVPAYCNVLTGSGASALDALRKLGTRRVPVFMYGFSSGARFTVDFAEHFPNALSGWCAMSLKGDVAAVKPDEGKTVRPAGLVVYGSEDPSLEIGKVYYQSGRDAGRRWSWAEQDGLAHARSKESDEFIQKYFLAVLHGDQEGVLINPSAGTRPLKSADFIDKTQRIWLPCESLVDPWRKLTARKTSGIVEHAVETGVDGYEKMTFFMKLPDNGPPAGVLCISMAARKRATVLGRLVSKSTEDKLLDFAAKRNFAVVVWAAKRLWSASKDVGEMSESEKTLIAKESSLMAKAWDTAMDRFVKRYGIPSAGYLISGTADASQFVQRLVQLRPGRFLAAHIHMAGSYDIPLEKGSAVLWCVTTGENERGYSRSREFFRKARDLRYPIIYKAYQGLGEEGKSQTPFLCLASFNYACAEHARALRISGGRNQVPDWADLFSSSLYVADIFNQAVYSKFDYSCVPPEFRMLIPSRSLCEAWARE